MNDTRVKGAAKVVAGRFESAAGDVLDNTEMRVGGRVREAAGHVQEVAGSARDLLEQTVEQAVSAASTAGKAYGGVVDSAHGIARTIEQRPRLSVGLAGAVGLLVGMLIAGRGPKIVYVKPKD